jgi:hypothetical protein
VLYDQSGDVLGSVHGPLTIESILFVAPVSIEERDQLSLRHLCDLPIPSAQRIVQACADGQDGQVVLMQLTHRTEVLAAAVLTHLEAQPACDKSDPPSQDTVESPFEMIANSENALDCRTAKAVPPPPAGAPDRLGSASPMSSSSGRRSGSLRVTAARVTDSIPPGAGAVVMGTGIVSIDIAAVGQEPLSLALLAVAAVAWTLLGLLLAARFLRGPARFRREAALPASLAGVAGTAVLGTRLTLLGWWGAGALMLAIATPLWIGLVVRVLRRWVTPTVGVSFIVTVATESLAVLLAVLGLARGWAWPVLLAVVPLVLGVGFYAFVVVRFDLRQLLVGRGDHWVAGGALAISTLACGQIALASHALHLLGDGVALRVATLTLWLTAIAWLPGLVVTELSSRRVLYDTRRWSTVFPVGMYAACTFVTGQALGLDGLTQFARVWTWFGLAVWAAVLTAMLWQPLAVLQEESAATRRREQAGCG